ncbi:MAG: hypothetical protein N2595_04510 [bacterium]|nr:hypothetical protein [bacterium]
MVFLRLVLARLKKSYPPEATPALALWFLLLLIQAPLWLDGRPGILDAPVIAYVCQKFNWRHLLSVVDIMGFGNQARPLQFLAFLPAFVSRDPWFYHLFQNVFVLLLTSYLIFSLAYMYTRRAWLSFLAAFSALITPPYTPNWFVLWTMEPYMLFGILGFSYILLRLLSPAPPSRVAWLTYNVTGVLFAAYAVGVKEVGLMSSLALSFAAFILARFHHLSFDDLLSRAWPALTALESAAVLVLVKLLTIPHPYDAGGTGGYVISTVPILLSLQKFIIYFIDAAPYAWIALLAWFILISLPSDLNHPRASSTPLRTRCLAALIFFLIAFAMAGVYVPWQVFDARYLLVPSVFFVIAAWLVADALFFVAPLFSHFAARFSARAAAVLIVTLILLHTAYTLAVGPLSEGPARYGLAAAYDDMFRYLASSAPTNATIYFFMDARFPEARENTVHSLNVFYNRPDLRIIFPSRISSFRRPGLLVVSEYQFPMNYTRMPVHHEANERFTFLIQPQLSLRKLASFIHETPVWYAREEHNAVQYSSLWGLPAFWGLKSGTYRFGWTIYEFHKP